MKGAEEFKRLHPNAGTRHQLRAQAYSLLEAHAGDVVAAQRAMEASGVDAVTAELAVHAARQAMDSLAKWGNDSTPQP